MNDVTRFHMDAFKQLLGGLCFNTGRHHLRHLAVLFDHGDCDTNVTNEGGLKGLDTCTEQAPADGVRVRPGSQW